MLINHGAECIMALQLHSKLLIDNSTLKFCTSQRYLTKPLRNPLIFVLRPRHRYFEWRPVTHQELPRLWALCESPAQKACRPTTSRQSIDETTYKGLKLRRKK